MENSTSFSITGSAPLAPLERPKHRFVLCVISSNPELAQACRSTLDNICPSAYSIKQCDDPWKVPADCDIYVLDFDSASSFPSAMATASAAAKVVVGEKSTLSKLRGNIPGGDLTFLSTPLNALSLQAVLCSTIARLQLGNRAKSTPLGFDPALLLQKLMETNVRLYEYDEQRSNFLTRAVHDVRVPLTAIQGYCEVLLGGHAGSIQDNQTEILGRMHRSVSRLRRIIEAVLDLGAGAQIKAKPKFRNVDIEACVRQAAHEIGPFAEKKGITLTVELEPADTALTLDPGQIEQVLINLLDNACKFTPKNGSITIRGRSIAAEQARAAGCFSATGGYRLDLSDTGPGISPENLERIFDEYASYGDPMDRSGFGLGLAICRMIVNAHHGRIWATSDARGATFSLIFPAADIPNDSPWPTLTV